MRQRGPVRACAMALCRRSRGAEARDPRREAYVLATPDEYAANLITRGYMPGWQRVSMNSPLMAELETSSRDRAGSRRGG